MMTRDRTKVRFKTTLDPALMLEPQEAVDAVSKGKGKARAAADDNINRRKARKPMSRVNSLILSTDSPKYIRPQMQQAGSSSRLPPETFLTIGSFGSRSSMMSCIDHPAERDLGPSPAEVARNTRTHTSLSSKRKRPDVNRAKMRSDATSLLNQTTHVVPSIGNDTADEEWNNIWGRWNSQSHTARSSASYANQHTLADLQEVIEEAEKHLSASQQSLLSIHSEDGLIETNWSIYEGTLPIEGEELHRNEKSLPQTEALDESRSLMDEGLLLDSVSSAEKEGEEKDEQIKLRIEKICDDSTKGMKKTRHIIFEGDAVRGKAHIEKDNITPDLADLVLYSAAHFSPAWDGYQLKIPPPSRSELADWSADKTVEGQLYDYEDMDLIPHWHDEALSHS